MSRPRRRLLPLLVITLTSALAAAQPVDPMAETTAPAPAPAAAPVYPPPPGPAAAPTVYAAAPAPEATYQPRTGVKRDGFLVGIGAGAGMMTCDDCRNLEGLAVNLTLGGMVSQRAAVMFDGWGVIHFADGGQIINNASTVAAQLWVSDRAWIKGGLGLGRLMLQADNGESDSIGGVAFTAAAGYEVSQGTSSAVDLQLRLATVSYDHGSIQQLGVNLAYNWY
ncbi:MAG: hypothetical protein IT370_31495 [Deltaproteobacteria bacterium]|nr:hypothetical protein [Deltaproteobacteria bacterium]